MPKPLESDLVALLWQKCDFCDSQREISLIHEEPAFVEAGDGGRLARRSWSLANAISGGFAAQDADAGGCARPEGCVRGVASAMIDGRSDLNVVLVSGNCSPGWQKGLARRTGR